jgi:pilus assembly protein Flp/PilA
LKRSLRACLQILTSMQGRLDSVDPWIRTSRKKRQPNPRSDSHVWIMEPIMTNLLKRFLKDESGATAIEYGLIAAGISVAIIAVVQGLGSKLTSLQTALK